MASKTEEQTTPLMQQYYSAKAKYPDAILLYRMGDFYETFGEDAKLTAKILGITLTKRSHGSPGDVELAGFPYHAIDNYLPKLVRAGQRVAICEQLEDPKKTKKLVKRGVIELVTPGVSYNETKITFFSLPFILPRPKPASPFWIFPRENFSRRKAPRQPWTRY